MTKDIFNTQRKGQNQLFFIPVKFKYQFIFLFQLIINFLIYVRNQTYQTGLSSFPTNHSQFFLFLPTPLLLFALSLSEMSLCWILHNQKSSKSRSKHAGSESSHYMNTFTKCISNVGTILNTVQKQLVTIPFFQ